MTLYSNLEKAKERFPSNRRVVVSQGSRRDGHKNNEGDTPAAPRPPGLGREAPTGSGRKVMGKGRQL